MCRAKLTAHGTFCILRPISIRKREIVASNLMEVPTGVGELQHLHYLYHSKNAVYSTNRSYTKTSLNKATTKVVLETIH